MSRGLGLGKVGQVRWLRDSQGSSARDCAKSRMPSKVTPTLLLHPDALGFGGGVGYSAISKATEEFKANSPKMFQVQS